MTPWRLQFWEFCCCCLISLPFCVIFSMSALWWTLAPSFIIATHASVYMFSASTLPCRCKIMIVCLRQFSPKPCLHTGFNKDYRPISGLPLINFLAISVLSFRPLMDSLPVISLYCIYLGYLLSFFKKIKSYLFPQQNLTHRELSV